MKQAPQLQDSRGRLVQGGVELGSECSERDQVGFLYGCSSQRKVDERAVGAKDGCSEAQGQWLAS